MDGDLVINSVSLPPRLFRKAKDAKWEFELKMSNILNINSQVRTSANTISVLNSETYIQPRFLTLRAVYNL